MDPFPDYAIARKTDFCKQNMLKKVKIGTLSQILNRSASKMSLTLFCSSPLLPFLAPVIVTQCERKVEIKLSLLLYPKNLYLFLWLLWQHSSDKEENRAAEIHVGGNLIYKAIVRKIEVGRRVM